MGSAVTIDSADASVILCVARRSLIHAHHSTWETAMRTLLVSAAFGLGAEADGAARSCGAEGAVAPEPKPTPAFEIAAAFDIRS